MKHIKNLAGARTPAMADLFLFLAEIIFRKSDQPDLGLVERNNKVLEATALCYYVMNLSKEGSSSSEVDFSEPQNKATEKIKTLQDALLLSMEIDVAEGQKVFDKIKKHQVYLQEIRNGLRVGLQSMAVMNHDDLNEYDHYQKIQKLYKVVAEGLIRLITEILDDWFTLLVPAPCCYAAIVPSLIPF